MFTDFIFTKVLRVKLSLVLTFFVCPPSGAHILDTFQINLLLSLNPSSWVDETLLEVKMNQSRETCRMQSKVKNPHYFNPPSSNSFNGCLSENKIDSVSEKRGYVQSVCMRNCFVSSEHLRSVCIVWSGLLEPSSCITMLSFPFCETVTMWNTIS